MSYGADFTTADPANAPLDPPIFIGAEPMVLAAGFLLLLAAALLGYWYGLRKQPPQDAAGAIWNAVDSAAKDAMKADTDALPEKAAALQREVQARLGKTLHFVGELGGCIKALNTAIKGETEDTTPPAPPKAKTEREVAEAEAGGASAAAAAANVTIVSVHASPAACAPPACAPTPPCTPVKPAKRPMTTPERNDALRLAVAAFNDHWRHRSARESEMRAVVRELCDPGPPPPKVHGAHH